MICYAKVNAANELLFGWKSLVADISKAARSILLDECQNLTGSRASACKVTSGYKLPACMCSLMFEQGTIMKVT